MLYALYCILAWFILLTAWTVIAARWFELRNVDEKNMSFIGLVSATGFALAIFHMIDVRFSVIIAAVVAFISLVVANTNIHKMLNGFDKVYRKKSELLIGLTAAIVVVVVVLYVTRFIP